MGRISDLLERLTRRLTAAEAAEALREDLAGAIATGHSEGAMAKDDRDRLLAALDLSSRRVDEVMRHRAQIEMLDADMDPVALVQAVLDSAHTRLPVFRDQEDNIIGTLHAKDLFREVARLSRDQTLPWSAAVAGLDVVKIAMKPYFVPETTALDEQMRQFLKRRTHVALVVDEYGELEGLLTLEDILEEIVGDITDEFDVIRREGRLDRQPDGTVIVPGQMTLRDLNRAMDWSLPDSDANTVAGLVIHDAQIIPEEGQVFAFHGFRFQVLSRRENRLARLGVRPLQAGDPVR